MVAQRGRLEGLRMYVCHCRAVTDCRIREVIAAGATSLAEVARQSGAGITCGGCLPGVERVLHEQGHHTPPRRRVRERPALQPQPAGG
jgi:bacterioferritin-associated ferredoxin